MTPLQEELIVSVFARDEATMDRILHDMTGQQRLQAVRAFSDFIRLIVRLRIVQLQQDSQPSSPPASRLH